MTSFVRFPIVIWKWQLFIKRKFLVKQIFLWKKCNFAISDARLDKTTNVMFLILSTVYIHHISFQINSTFYMNRALICLKTQYVLCMFSHNDLLRIAHISNWNCISPPKGKCQQSHFFTGNDYSILSKHSRGNQKEVNL